jgi:hypothetical protein
MFVHGRVWSKQARHRNVQDAAAPLTVHHSRDTFTKQWMETLEKALRGWAAYLKVMLIHVMHLPCFQEDWLTLIGVLKSLITMDHLPDDPRSRKVRCSCACAVSYVVCTSQREHAQAYLKGTMLSTALLPYMKLHTLAWRQQAIDTFVLLTVHTTWNVPCPTFVGWISTSLEGLKKSDLSLNGFEYHG